MTQLQLEQERPAMNLSPQCSVILEMLTLAKGRGVSGVEFVHAARIFAYSQRVGELRRAGYAIVSKRDGESPVHRYWLAEFYKDAA